jgi:hypothetical protein
MSWRTRRQRPAAGDLVDHRVNFSTRQPIEGDGGDVRLSDPGRFEFRPERHDQKRAMGGDPAHRAPEHFQARGIAPMHILEDHQHGSRARQRLYLRDERL